MMGYRSGIRPDICIALRIIALHERYRCDQEFLEKMMTDDIVNRLNITADMIGLDHKISYGSDSAIMREAADEIDKLRAALKPFADVAENDICDSLTDADIFRPMTREYSRASMLTVGDLRAAKAALGESDE